MNTCYYIQFSVFYPRTLHYGPIAEGAWISQQSHTRMTGNFEIAFRYRKLTLHIEAFFFDEDLFSARLSRSTYL